MTRKISLYAVITALTVAVSMVFIIPVPATNGFVTLADAGIYIASLLFGPIGGLTVGALSGGLIDLMVRFFVIDSWRTRLVSRALL